MATKRKVCRFCGDHLAFGVTDLDGNRALVCPACVPADAPPPPAFEVIRAALAEADLTPPLGHEERMIASIEAERARLDAEQTDSGAAGPVIVFAVAAVVLVLGVLTILQIAGVL